MVLNIVGLEICVPELIWTIINFFLLMFLLKIFLYKPVLKILDERRAKVEEGFAESKMAEADLKETNAAVTEELSAQNAKAREYIGQAKAEAENERDAVVADAHKEAESMNKGVRERIEAEEKAAKCDVEDSMPELVMLLTKKLVGDEGAECSPELIKSCVDETKGN